MIATKDLTVVRKAVNALPTRGRRLHFHDESDGQRRRLLGAVAELSRQDDSDDAGCILRHRAPHRSPTFEHRTAAHEPLLGLADAVTWAAGAGDRGRKLVEPILDGIVEVRP